MSIPHLIHPIDIDIEQISPATTIYDPDTREPIQQVARSALFTIKGQPRFRSQTSVNLERGGNRGDGNGYILFRIQDLNRAAVTINLNDKITRIGHVTGVEFFVTKIEWIGHLPRHNGPSLLKAWFDDRDPSKQSGV